VCRALVKGHPPVREKKPKIEARTTKATEQRRWRSIEEIGKEKEFCSVSRRVEIRETTGKDREGSKEGETEKGCKQRGNTALRRYRGRKNKHSDYLIEYFQTGKSSQQG